MPVASSLRELIDALQTGKTNTMRALDDLFGSQAALSRVAEHPNVGELDDDNVFESGPGSGLPPWAVVELQGAGSLPMTHPLSPDEIDHINDWPSADKEKVRKVLKAALGATPRTPLEFFWEMHDGDDEEVVTTAPGRVTFRSPKVRARLSGPGKDSTTIEVRVKRPGS